MTSPSKLDHALDLANQGFRVFPLIPNGKIPAIKGWQAKATSDASAITQWWTSNPDRNIGIATGDGLIVLDVDNKNGVDGDASLKSLEMIHDDLPPTFTVNNGRSTHYYFDAGCLPGRVRNSASKIGDGLDVKGTGGLVVGPGSVVDGRTYRVVHAVPKHPVPTWLAGQLALEHHVQLADVPATAPGVTLDTPDAQTRAAIYLETAEPAIEGAGGDHHTYAVACRVRDFGLSQPVALELMASLWNERCSPPWDVEALSTKVANAYAYAAKPAGNASPQADFEPIPLAKGKLYLERYKDIQLLKTNPYLIEDCIDMHALSVLYGESNVGKTFVAVDMAYAIAASALKPVTWNGRRVRGGAVVYIAAEGGLGIRKRISALKKLHGDMDVPLAVIPCPVNLMGGSRSDVAAISDLVNAYAAEVGFPVVLTVVDTLSRAMAGANENASEDMTAFVGAVDKLRVTTGAHGMVVHHSGKDTTKGSRGHSSLRAALDTELEIVDNTLLFRKQRDIEAANEIHFRLNAIELARDEDGKPITSCTVEWAAPGEEFRAIELTPLEMECWQAVRDAQAASGKDHATLKQILAVMPGMNERTLFRRLSVLGQKSAAENLTRGRWRAVDLS